MALCCRRARSQGVTVGMPLAEAQSLAHGLASLRHDSQADRRELEKLAEACDPFSPRVALEESDCPESLMLDISNLEHLWGSEARLAKVVEQSFRRHGYHVRVGIADTVGAAWAAAHFDSADAHQEASSSQHSPAIAAPRFAEVFSPGTHGLQALPIEALRISDETTLLLRELGVETIAQLCLLPREELKARFGEDLLLRLGQFQGRSHEIIEPHRGLPALRARHVLEQPTGDHTLLRHVLAHLVEELTGNLIKRDEGAVLLVCLFHCANKEILPLRVGLLQPTASACQLLELIDLHLEKLKLNDEVNQVEVRASVTGKLDARQRELFTDRSSSDPHQLALLVNRLSSRLGCERVLQVKLRASPVPERVAHWEPVLGKELLKTRGGRERRTKTSQTTKATCGAESFHASPRPLLLYPEPHPIEVTCIEPDGLPQFAWLSHRRERIIDCTGPQRIETLWWRGASIRRDYYRTFLESGS